MESLDEFVTVILLTIRYVAQFVRWVGLSNLSLVAASSCRRLLLSFWAAASSCGLVLCCVWCCCLLLTSSPLYRCCFMFTSVVPFWLLMSPFAHCCLAGPCAPPLERLVRGVVLLRPKGKGSSDRFSFRDSFCLSCPHFMHVTSRGISCSVLVPLSSSIRPPWCRFPLGVGAFLLCHLLLFAVHVCGVCSVCGVLCVWCVLCMFCVLRGVCVLCALCVS